MLISGLLCWVYFFFADYCFCLLLRAPAIVLLVLIGVLFFEPPPFSLYIYCGVVERYRRKDGESVFEPEAGIFAVVLDLSWHSYRYILVIVIVIAIVWMLCVCVCNSFFFPLLIIGKNATNFETDEFWLIFLLILLIFIAFVTLASHRPTDGCRSRCSWSDEKNKTTELPIY